MTKYAVIIPARYTSTRLPGKPLINLLGTPMIIRTYRQVIKAIPEEYVYVATESKKIQEYCTAKDIKVLMTSDNCLTGTDRIAECAKLLPEIEIFINVQGDEPVFEPNDIKLIQKAALKNPSKIINGFCSIDGEEQYRSATTPKVVLRKDGRLLYMSRAPIPTTKQHSFKTALRQVCCYAFPRKALLDFAAHDGKTPLEEIEDIEILRFLELGHEVHMIKLSANSIAVDVPEDVAKVEAAIKERQL